jgi:apolipoprotein N-acyltransferase
MVRYALAALSGALYFLGFAGFDLWPLALVALVPLLWVLDPRHGALSRKRIWGLGLTAGVVMNVGGYYWIEGTLERFSGFPFVACAAITLLLCVYQGILLVIFAFLYHHGVRHAGSRIVAACAAMCVAEWLFPMLFKHFFGASLHALPLLLQTADLGGPLMVTGLLTLASVGVYTALLAYLDGRKKESVPSSAGSVHRFSFRTWPWREPVIALGVWLCAIAYGAYRIAEVDARVAKAPTLQMGLIQANMGLFQKREDPEEGLRRHVEQSLQMQREHPGKLDLLLWPESAFGWALPEGVANVTEAVLGGNIHTPTLFGGLALRRHNGRRRFFNTAFMADEHGNVTGTYDKTYLLTFSEYMPFAEEFPILQRWSPNSGNFVAGAHVRPLRLGKFRLSVLICYEDILPSFVRRVEQEGNPHVLINLTNDAWFGDTHAPWEHLALAKLRSVEHHRALVRATNSGVSAVIDPVGRVTAKSALFTRENLYAAVPMLETSYPYHVLGDFPGPLSALILVGLWIVQRKRSAGSAA